MGLDDTGYDGSVEDTLAACMCLDDYRVCVAVDYKDGKCMKFTINEYSSMTLIINVGNVHSILKPCDIGTG